MVNAPADQWRVGVLGAYGVRMLRLWPPTSLFQKVSVHGRAGIQPVVGWTNGWIGSNGWVNGLMDGRMGG
eukprot:366332-Chlamydomonas_euryale.AAC.20